MSEEIDCDVVKQPQLSPGLQDKIADTFRRKTGREASREEVLAWWDWVWPNFEQYWGTKRYKNVSRAIQGWASRVRPHELSLAMEAKERSETFELEQKQITLNEQANVTSIDYFSKKRGVR